MSLDVHTEIRVRECVYATENVCKGEGGKTERDYVSVCVSVCERKCVCERESVCERVCVSVKERKREKERVCVFLKSERERVCVCV